MYVDFRLPPPRRGVLAGPEYGGGLSAREGSRVTTNRGDNPIQGGRRDDRLAGGEDDDARVGVDHPEARLQPVPVSASAPSWRTPNSTDSVTVGHP